MRKPSSLLVAALFLLTPPIAAGQRGFNASLSFHLARSYR